MRIIVVNILLVVISCHYLLAQTSGSVTQGVGVTIHSDIMPNCPSNHVTPLGRITSADNRVWLVPTDSTFLRATKLPDLYNQCNSAVPTDISAINLKSIPVTTIDIAGDTITGFLFADNYFELYINGVLVGVDPVPFTPFNSSVVRFKVSRPYTIACKLVDWEENLGLGSEKQTGNNYHPGDGGFIAQFSDGTKTDSTWKTQSFYIAPIQNLSDVVELPNGIHSTANATITPTCNNNCYGVHYVIPNNWEATSFDDSSWPNAKIYSAAQVTNQPAYTNFAKTAWGNANFIWSSNLILDNVVLTRKRVVKNSSAGMQEIKTENSFQVVNPVKDRICIYHNDELRNAKILLKDLFGRDVVKWNDISSVQELNLLISPAYVPSGMYVIMVICGNKSFVSKLIVNN